MVIWSPVLMAPNITVGGVTLYSVIFITLVPVMVKLLSAGLYFSVPTRSVSFVVPEMVRLPVPLNW